MTDAERATLLTFAIAQFLGAASPGPSFLFVVRATVGVSRGAGLTAALGMGVGASLWAIAALLGVTALFARAPELYALAQVGGGGFLVWIAWRIWAQASTPLDASAGAPRATRRIFVDAVKFQLANPKVAVFFGSVFVALLPREAPFAMRIALPTIVFVNETLWYVFVACALSVPALRARYLGWKAGIDRAAAILIFLIALRLAAAPFIVGAAATG